MELHIIPMQQEEEKYTYAQSSQLRWQTGSIGYLRGDFAFSGSEFYVNWEDHRQELKTEEFKREIDEVINSLRSSDYGLLKDRTSMNKFVNRHPNSAMKGNYTEEYGFRVDTKKYSYLIRCNPTKGDYNFYVFCYVRESLNRHIRDARKGIRFIDSHYNELFRIKDGDKITITLSTGEKLDRVCRYIDEYHTEIGTNLNHICEFAERMECVGNTYAPKNEEDKPKILTHKQKDFER